MTVYNVSTLSSSSVLAFVPGSDILRFDSQTIASLNLGAYAVTGGCALMGSGKTIVLQGISLAQLDTVRIEVADGTPLYIAGSTFQAVDGSAGNDQLLGQMIAGATLRGGAGSDVYVVDDVLDTVVEAENAGIDSVRSYVSLTLSAHVENLSLLGSAHLSGYGNELANNLLGNNGNNLLDGGAGNDWIDGGIGADTMIGGAGSDGYAVNEAGDVVTEASGEGIDGVRSSISYTLGANLENLYLTGSANLTGTGNELNNFLSGNTGRNVLEGGAGTDWLEGGAGIDTLIGGTGDDTYVVDNSGDVLTEGVDEGTDTVRSTVTYTLGNNFERLQLLGSDNINGTGNALANTIIGNTGNNSLTGGAGADSLYGGAGNDTYVVDNSRDLVVELAGAGTDTVYSSLTYTLGAELEILRLTGTANLNGTGNALNNQIYGNDGNNLLIGGAGNDQLDGGMGLDTLQGGTGDDTYVIYDTPDPSDSNTVVLEDAGAGNDTVRSYVSYVLNDNLENLRLLGTQNLNGTGSAQSNQIFGNSGNNLLDGGAGNDLLDGGAGTDTLIGGVGNDDYVIDSLSDVIVEEAGGGSDTVRSSVSHALGENFESLILTGSSNLSGTGNALGNQIYGNAGSNILDAGDGNDWVDGGAGADILIGGAGSDGYVVDNQGDIVVEEAGAGTDSVSSSVSFLLGANVENLELSGSASINGTGNELANTIKANTGANILTGGLGADTFVLKPGSQPLASAADRITDFVSGSDRLLISQTGLPIGDGDALLEGATLSAGPGGFSTAAELVVITGNLAGLVNSTSLAAAAIGSASSAYAIGARALFVVDNGADSGVYLFSSAGNDAQVSGSELTLLATLTSTASTTLGDYGLTA